MAAKGLKRTNWDEVTKKHRRRIDLATVVYYWQAFSKDDDHNSIKQHISSVLEQSDLDLRYLKGITESVKATKSSFLLQPFAIDEEVIVLTADDVAWFESYRDDMSSITPYADDDESINEYLEPVSLLERDEVELPLLMDVKNTKCFIDLDDLLRKLKVRGTYYPEELDRPDMLANLNQPSSFPTKKIQFIIQAHDYVFGKNGIYKGEHDRRTLAYFKDEVVKEFLEKIPKKDVVKDQIYALKDDTNLKFSKRSFDSVFFAITPDTPFTRGNKPT